MGPITVIVNGTPAPQGSKTRTAHGGMRESSRAVAPWREAVRHATQTAIAAATAPAWEAPYAACVHVVFTLRRPASHYGTGRHAHLLKPQAPQHPRGRPDLDKLIRSTLDALTDAGALTDDSTVIRLDAVKCYPGGNLDALDTPGAIITVRPEGPP